VASGLSTTLPFTWNASAFEYGRYNTSAYVVEQGDAPKSSGHLLAQTSLVVTIPGDVNGDYKVDLSDLVSLAMAYGTNSTNAQTIGIGSATHLWNPNADINGDGVVGLSDLVTLATHYGKSVTP
jgi:hypothetical protein